MVAREELLRKDIDVFDFGVWRRRFEIEVLSVVVRYSPFWFRRILRTGIGWSRGIMLRRMQGAFSIPIELAVLWGVAL